MAEYFISTRCFETRAVGEHAQQLFKITFDRDLVNEFVSDYEGKSGAVASDG